jgi:hypothetical protein
MTTETIFTELSESNLKYVPPHLDAGLVAATMSNTAIVAKLAPPFRRFFKNHSYMLLQAYHRAEVISEELYQMESPSFMPKSVQFKFQHRAIAFVEDSSQFRMIQAQSEAAIKACQEALIVNQIIIKRMEMKTFMQDTMFIMIKCVEFLVQLYIISSNIPATAATVYPISVKCLFREEFLEMIQSSTSTEEEVINYLKFTKPTSADALGQMDNIEHKATLDKLSIFLYKLSYDLYFAPIEVYINTAQQAFDHMEQNDKSTEATTLYIEMSLNATTFKNEVRRSLDKDLVKALRELKTFQEEIENVMILSDKSVIAME